MNWYQVEFGTFWVWEAGQGLPPVVSVRQPAEFKRVVPTDFPALAAAMGVDGEHSVRQRHNGRRRCFCLKVGSRLVCYGWVTNGPERVGELERTFNLKTDEAYIWDCGTVPDMRGQGLYSALLNQMAAQLVRESFKRVWIGASQRNAPSVKGIQNAGFQQVIDLTYRRILPISMLRFYRQGNISKETLEAAYQILLRPRELRIGNLAVGVAG